MSITMNGDTATVTTTATRSFTIIDAGTKYLGTIKNDDGEECRIGWEVEYDDATRTITVHRGRPYSALGHERLPEFEPLNDNARHQIVELVADQLERGTWKHGEPFAFYDKPLSDYHAEVEALIEHPDWCDGERCSATRHDIAHKGRENTFEWAIAANDRAIISSHRVLNAEHYKLGQEREDEWVEVQIDGNTCDGFVATPDQLRQIGEYFISEAARLSALTTVRREL